MIQLQLLVLRGDADGARALWAEIEPVTSVSAYPMFRAGAHLAIAISTCGSVTGAAPRATERDLGGAGSSPADADQLGEDVADQAEALLGLGRATKRGGSRPGRTSGPATGHPRSDRGGVRARASCWPPKATMPRRSKRPKRRSGSPRQVPFRTARALFTLGEVLRRSRQKAASRQAFEAALGLFAPRRADWIDRTQAELGRVASRRPAGAALTDTERRVAELAAAGHTNREIAAALFMSVHTVEAHLTRVFRTLGVRTRTELARTSLDGNDRWQATRGPGFLSPVGTAGIGIPVISSGRGGTTMAPR